MKREPKVVTSVCHCCRRGGWTRTVPYSLWTPEEYADFGPEMIGRERAQATKAGLDLRNDVLCIAHAGSSIHEAVREALDLAREWRKPVAFMFNEKPVRARPGDDAEAIVRAWWVSRYSETPEESAAKR